MLREDPKTLLDQADNPVEREAAVRAAIRLGTPLHEVEQYLDWLDAMKKSGVDSGDE